MESEKIPVFQICDPFGEPHRQVPVFIVYEQSYTLPDDVEKGKISAKVEDGILTVILNFFLPMSDIFFLFCTFAPIYFLPHEDEKGIA